MIVLRVEAGLAAAAALADIKLLSTGRFHGTHQLTLRAGGRALDLGPLWTFDASEACLAALGEFGTVEAVEA